MAVTLINKQTHTCARNPWETYGNWSLVLFLETLSLALQTPGPSALVGAGLDLPPNLAPEPSLPISR